MEGAKAQDDSRQDDPTLYKVPPSGSVNMTGPSIPSGTLDPSAALFETPSKTPQLESAKEDVVNNTTLATIPIVEETPTLQSQVALAAPQSQTPLVTQLASSWLSGLRAWIKLDPYLPGVFQIGRVFSSQIGEHLLDKATNNSATDNLLLHPHVYTQMAACYFPQEESDFSSTTPVQFFTSEDQYLGRVPRNSLEYPQGLFVGFPMPGYAGQVFYRCISFICSILNIGETALQFRQMINCETLHIPRAQGESVTVWEGTLVHATIPSLVHGSPSKSLAVVQVILHYPTPRLRLRQPIHTTPSSITVLMDIPTLLFSALLYGLSKSSTLGGMTLSPTVEVALALCPLTNSSIWCVEQGRKYWQMRGINAIFRSQVDSQANHCAWAEKFGIPLVIVYNDEDGDNDGADVSSQLLCSRPFDIMNSRYSIILQEFEKEVKLNDLF
jgi:hypothetical protein